MCCRSLSMRRTASWGSRDAFTDGHISHHADPPSVPAGRRTLAATTRAHRHKRHYTPARSANYQTMQQQQNPSALQRTPSMTGPEHVAGNLFQRQFPSEEAARRMSAPAAPLGRLCASIIASLFLHAACISHSFSLLHMLYGSKFSGCKGTHHALLSLCCCCCMQSCAGLFQHHACYLPCCSGGMFAYLFASVYAIYLAGQETEACSMLQLGSSSPPPCLIELIACLLSLPLVPTDLFRMKTPWLCSSLSMHLHCPLLQTPREVPGQYVRHLQHAR